MDLFDESDRHSAAVQPNEPPRQFGARAEKILNAATSMSRELGGNYSEMNRHVLEAERLGFGVVEAWAYAIVRMREKNPLEPAF